MARHPDTNPDKMCGGKVKHESRAEARVHANAGRANFGGKWSTYRCGFCGSWHTGHMSKAQAKRKGNYGKRFREYA